MFIFLTLVASVPFFAFVSANLNATCNTFGIDFKDGQTYFINAASNDTFTVASQFEGCNPDIANVMFVGPLGANSEEYDCSDVQTTPDDVTMLSICPVTKNELTSGQYLIILSGDNGDSVYPFASQRNISLSVGTQITTTVTPTVTWNVSSTPITTVTSSSFVSISHAFNATTTYIVPAETANTTKTVTPKAATTTVINTISHIRPTWTWEKRVTTVTTTASCTIPPKPANPDPPCSYTPTKVHTGWPHWTSIPKRNVNVERKADSAVDSEYGRVRIQRSKDRKAKRAGKVFARAPDQPILTVTVSAVSNSTQTITAPAATITDLVLVTITIETTLPASTIYSGVYIPTVTAAQPTKTRYSVTYTNVVSTKTVSATWTKTKTITPSASVTACKMAGGHFGPGWWS